MSFPRRFYVLLHTPVELARPTSLGIFRSCARNDALFEEFVNNVEYDRRVHGIRNYNMTKVEAQKWTPYLPTGLRAQVVQIVIPPYLLE